VALRCGTGPTSHLYVTVAALSRVFDVLPQLLAAYKVMKLSCKFLRAIVQGQIIKCPE
jgi:hypothetical protein